MVFQAVLNVGWKGVDANLISDARLPPATLHLTNVQLGSAPSACLPSNDPGNCNLNRSLRFTCRLCYSGCRNERIHRAPFAFLSAAATTRSRSKWDRVPFRYPRRERSTVCRLRALAIHHALSVVPCATKPARTSRYKFSDGATARRMLCEIWPIIDEKYT